MNKMHTLAKILITILIVYLLVVSLGALILLLDYIRILASQTQTNNGILMVIASMVLQLAIILFLISVLYRRNKIAERIVGKEEISLPQSQLDWIGFAYRLISVIAGLYCFSKILFYLGNFSRIFMCGAYSNNSQPIFNSEALQQGISILILLVAGIYLFCGAPHFVKWQTRKTIEMCTGNSNDKKQ